MGFLLLPLLAAAVLGGLAWLLRRGSTREHTTDPDAPPDDGRLQRNLSAILTGTLSAIASALFLIRGPGLLSAKIAGCLSIGVAVYFAQRFATGAIVRRRRKDEIVHISLTHVVWFLLILAAIPIAMLLVIDGPARRFAVYSAILVPAIVAGTLAMLFSGRNRVRHTLHASRMIFTGNAESAELELRRQLEERTATADLQNAYAMVLAHLDRFEEAIPYFERAAMDPRFEKLAEFGRGRALWKSGRIDEGEAVLRGAAQEEPTRAAASLCLGELLAERGAVEEAEVFLADALETAKRQRLDRVDPMRDDLERGRAKVEAALRERNDAGG